MATKKQTKKAGKLHVKPLAKVRTLNSPGPGKS